MTAYVLESLEGRNCVAFAAACEALWGHPRSAPNKEVCDVLVRMPTLLMPNSLGI